MSSEIKKTLHEQLKIKFAKEENEWVDVKIVNSKLIDVKIVSDEEISRKDFLIFIDEWIVKTNKETNSTYKRGLIRKYSLEEAEEIGIQKPRESKFKNMTFKELTDIKNNVDKIEREEDTISRIISFYSYKGGVGRTIALIQSAYELAKKGKKVLLIDLDLEAPSFYNIFKDNIKKENGIVDYLYERMHGIEEKITFNDIISKVSNVQEGEIYFIPAGKLSIDYINKLDTLKEKRIYEHKYIQRLINDIQKQFKIEYTFIDSRTGINNWGALSLIDICHEIFLFAYPNRENVEGIKLINELISDYKKTTVVFSRIDKSKEGKVRSQKLFNELNLNQEIISLYYEKEIALADSLPIHDLKDYDVISNFILEKEHNTKISENLSNKNEDIKSILKKIMDGKKSQIYSRLELKVKDKINSVIISDYDIFNKYTKCILELQEVIYLDEGYSEYSMPLFTDYDGKIMNDTKEYLEMYSESDINEKIAGIIALYIIRIIKGSLKDKEILEEKGTAEQFFKDFTPEKFVNKVIVGDKYQVVIFLKDVLRILSTCNRPEDELVENILKVVIYLNSKYDLSLKLIVDSDKYNSSKNRFDMYDQNIIKLDWNLLTKEQTETIIKEYISALYREIEVHIFNLMYDKQFDENSYFLEMILGNEVKKFDAEQIILGNRVEPKAYSQEIINWIYENLEMRKKLNQDFLMIFLKRAAEIELMNLASKQDYTRVISLNSMEKAIDEFSITI